MTLRHPAWLAAGAALALALSGCGGKSGGRSAAGGKVFAANTSAVLDEMPAAYKDLDTVMAHQRDLVDVVRRFTPLGTYKGSDAPRRGRGERRRDEER